MDYQWCIIGAGPAGIAAVGKLLDHGISPGEIAWIDPQFNVGNLGTLWRNIPSNSKVRLFTHFLNSCQSFNYGNCPIDFEINHAAPSKTCKLSLIADPLQWISNHLKETVVSISDIAEKLSLSQRQWNIQLKNSRIFAKNVILAVGAEPKALSSLSCHPSTIIPLQDAMDEPRIKNHLVSSDGKKAQTIGVFGSSHSAIIVLRNLVENKINKIINFYRSPIRYAVYMDDWILFDDSGLKGSAADWSREYIDGQIPDNLIRVYSDEENITRYFPQCDKVVYAVGFKRRSLPVVEGIYHFKYIEQCGIIAPGLFGLGIAFPEAKYNPIGVLEYRVGVFKFMEYLSRVMPIWLKYTA